jgi:hypothetical protein
LHNFYAEQCNPIKLTFKTFEACPRRQAGAVAHPKTSDTLQPTALVHEAWLRLVFLTKRLLEKGSKESN